jgi:hypothetical protein
MAIISDKFVFLHIPKTGGVWATHAMRQVAEIEMLGDQHNHFPALLDLRPEAWFKKKFIFTMIRHPISWYQSRWAFRIKHGWRMEHPLDYHCASNDFHQFVDNVLSFKPDGWVSWIYNTFIESVPGGIDYVARLENGADDLHTALLKSGVEHQKEQLSRLSRANDSDMGGYPSKHWAKYTDELFDRVMDVESHCINRYYPDYELDRNLYVGERPW